MKNNSSIALILMLAAVPRVFGDMSSWERMLEQGTYLFLSGNLTGAAEQWGGAMNAGGDAGTFGKLLGNCQGIIGKLALRGGDFRTARLSLQDARRHLPDREGLKALALIAELEESWPTGRAPALSPGMLETRVEQAAVFEVLFPVERKPQASPASSPQHALPAAGEGGDGEQIIYVTKHGDTLGSIAEQFYQDVNAWKKIWKQNPQLKNPHRLFPGTQLIIQLPR